MRYAGAILLAGCLTLQGIAQDVRVLLNTTVKVNPGTVVTGTNDLTLDNGATLDNEGTITLSGNLTNQNVTQSNLGGGLFQFSGTSAQTITGQNLFTNLEVNNAAGVILAGNTQVNGTLTLTNGLITLGTNTLLLGPAASVAGTPSASRMVVATGTGTLQKSFPVGTGAQAFTYPVGDNTGTAEYSPVSVSFTSGTYAAGNTLGVNLVNAAYPGMATDYLNRYWVFTAGGITAFNCNAQFNFVPADITGNIANIYCIRVAPDYATYNLANTGGSGSNYLYAAGLSSFSTFTGGHTALETSLVTFLQGPYDSTSHLMNTTLTTLPLGARTDPTKFPNMQPYNGSPWNYAGVESVTSLPPNVVDWVLVELRHAAAPGSATSGTVIARKAGFVLNNGSIVDSSGGTVMRFRNLAPFSDNLYVVVYHRNHIPVLAQNAVTKDANQIYTYDFSTGSDKVWNGVAGYKRIEVVPVKWGMVAGDANCDGNIWGNDYTNYWIPTFFYEGQYLPADFNLDKNVWGNDYTNYWIPNFFMENPLP